MGPVLWRTAMAEALYGERGFYRRGERPAAHFRTSVHASRRFGSVLGRLLVEVDAALGRPGRLQLVDIGAGAGELLVHIMSAVPELAGRLEAIAVELSPRPPELPAAIRWAAEPPEEITGLLIANEWLDNVPLDIVEQTQDGPRLVLVDPATGAETAGPAPPPEDLDWLARWWPLREPGDRAEVGRPRCAAWASVVARLRRGVALAVDYAHARQGRPPYGTLTGYRDGHVVPAVPDGSCDITAHVALDACAAAGERAGAAGSLRVSQRAALRALGVSGARPPAALARSDPRTYLGALGRAGEEAELIDPNGLGGHEWLVQCVGTPLPAVLHAAAAGAAT
ncbi:MAG TPA: SAM-dependent methyltransferase [Streptosporangiaceae bacterium]